MQSWKNLTSSLPAMPPIAMPQVDVTAMSKGFRNTVQSTRERLGQIDPSEVTELPAEYKALEARVDALYNVHKGMLKVAKVHETEGYDYPTQIGESVEQFGHQVATGWSSFATNNLKAVPFPLAPTPGAPPPHISKTLPHAYSRAAMAGAGNLGTTPEVGGAGTEEARLGKALETYGLAMEKVGDARISQDELIVDKFVTPWQATLSSNIALAMKARSNVKAARLELDGARAGLKSAGATKQEQARLQVEEAEDKLVQMTETAIGLMKAVLENPEPLQNLSSLVKAQLIFFSTAAEALSGIQGEIEEAAVAAEAEYRQTRA